MDELDAVLGECLACPGRGEHITLHLTRGAKTSVQAAQVGIVISRMAAELPGTFRDRADDGVEQLLVEASGGDDAEGAVSALEAGGGDLGAELSSIIAKGPDLAVPHPELRAPHDVRHHDCLDRGKRIAQGAHAEVPGGTQQGTQDAWE